MYHNDIEVEILVSGKPIKKFSHENRTYIQANKGSPFSIKVKNNSSKRRLFVVGIDGLNVLDGSLMGDSQHGYVICGYNSYEIKGFRTSNEEVHPFKFGEKSKSYAAKNEDNGGDISNCGAIGIKVFDEKIHPVPQVIEKHIHHWEKEYIPYTPPYNPYPTNPWWSQPYCGTTWYLTQSDTTNSLSSNDVQSRCFNASNNAIGAGNMVANYCSVSHPAEVVQDDAFDVGTEFSKESVLDKVIDTEFIIGCLLEVFEIFYTSKEGLIKLGVPVTKEVKINMPTAFPSGRFCKLPHD